MITFTPQELPVAESMLALIQQVASSRGKLFQDFLCYWASFNNIYTRVAEQKGLTKQRGKPPQEKQQLMAAYAELTEKTKDRLVRAKQVEFFVRRTPMWRGQPVAEFNANNQRNNGVLNVGYTTDRTNPNCSRIDQVAYKRYITQNPRSPKDQNEMAEQIFWMLYTVRNNTFHGEKRADDENAAEVIENALPLLKIIVESFIRRTGH